MSWTCSVAGPFPNVGLVVSGVASVVTDSTSILGYSSRRCFRTHSFGWFGRDTCKVRAVVLKKRACALNFQVFRRLLKQIRVGRGGCSSGRFGSAPLVRRRLDDLVADAEMVPPLNPRPAIRNRVASNVIL
jgi:hypothetical protein